jgi:hypothetical protein
MKILFTTILVEIRGVLHVRSLVRQIGETSVYETVRFEKWLASRVDDEASIKQD